MADVSPSRVLSDLAYAMPPACRGNVIIIGSLAAGFHFFGSDQTLFVRTKDADGVLRPRDKAVESGRAVAEQLLAVGWKHKTDGPFGKPGTAATKESDLPAVRLYPPSSTDWFVELLTLPASGGQSGLSILRLELSTGHYGIPSFEFLPVTTFEPLATPYDVFYARPEMMALANLLSHPTIATQLISGTSTKRSNKDLGRVLALARLSKDSDIIGWVGTWEKALRSCFPERWRELALHCGDGLRALLASRSDLSQAVDTCNTGLLNSQQVILEQMEITASRLLFDVVDPLETVASREA